MMISAHTHIMLLWESVPFCKQAVSRPESPAFSLNTTVHSVQTNIQTSKVNAQVPVFPFCAQQSGYLLLCSLNPSSKCSDFGLNNNKCIQQFSRKTSNCIKPLMTQIAFEHITSGGWQEELCGSGSVAENQGFLSAEQ